jgi:flagellar biosynthesis GTPase FlhF
MLAAHKVLVGALNIKAAVEVAQIPPAAPGIMQVPNPRTQEELFAGEDPLVRSSELMVVYAEQALARLQEISNVAEKNAAVVNVNNRTREKLRHSFEDFRTKANRVLEECETQYAQSMQQLDLSSEKMRETAQQGEEQVRQVCTKAENDRCEQRAKLEFSIQEKKTELNELKATPEGMSLAKEREVGTQIAKLEQEIIAAELGMQKFDEAFNRIEALRAVIVTPPLSLPPPCVPALVLDPNLAAATPTRTEEKGWRARFAERLFPEKRKRSE